MTTPDDRNHPPDAERVRFGYSKWEGLDEYIITMNGKPIGQTTHEKEALIISRWLGTAIKELQSRRAQQVSVAEPSEERVFYFDGFDSLERKEVKVAINGDVEIHYQYRKTKTSKWTYNQNMGASLTADELHHLHAQQAKPEGVPFEIIRQLTVTICESLKRDGWKFGPATIHGNYGPPQIQRDLIDKLEIIQQAKPALDIKFRHKKSYGEGYDVGFNVGLSENQPPLDIGAVMDGIETCIFECSADMGECEAMVGEISALLEKAVKGATP